MSIERINRLLNGNEGIHLEFKKAESDLPGNLFETICAMLNRDGGDVLLGVSDEGHAIGVDKACVNKIVSNIVKERCQNNFGNFTCSFPFLHRCK